MHYHYTLLAWHFFLVSINYMVKFACKWNFRAFSLEIKIFLLPFYFEFLVLQECKVVFREWYYFGAQTITLYLYLLPMFESQYISTSIPKYELNP